VGVDVVVVSFNSRTHLRECLEPLAAEDDFHVFVVDNASQDASLEAIRDLPVTAIAQGQNHGFAHACNIGFREGHAPYVLFLNPDARIESSALRNLAHVLDADPRIAAVGPRILTDNGSLDFSQRRFPRATSTFAQAFFLHRLLPHAAWTDELVRQPSSYETRSTPDWLSGACLLVRRSLLEALGGWDDGFFLYCEDMDLCARIWAAGAEIAYEPSATAQHRGGASAPRPSLFPTLASSRIRYACKHRGRLGVATERVGIVVGSLTHAVAGRGGWPPRLGHVRSLLVAVSTSCKASAATDRTDGEV
jgi:N-acetylglucosaminyl-diphospho-decaprenol L-rhamnosyltransferase